MRLPGLNSHVMDSRAEWDIMLHSPLFGALHPVLARLAERMKGRMEGFPGLDDLNALLETCHPVPKVRDGAPLRFVPQSAGRQPFEGQYEPRGYLKGEVQSREHNWHDLFNALVWLTFPSAKSAINAGHYAALLAGAGQGGRRGGARDGLTLLDESGVIVASAEPELESLLREFRWKELFWNQRARFPAGMGFFLFGHGLLEKALRPYVGMTGQGIVLGVDKGFFGKTEEARLAELDRALAARLAASGEGFSPRDLTPVPLLGVPGWSSQSRDPAFYDETGYFRPRRLLSSS